MGLTPHPVAPTGSQRDFKQIPIEISLVNPGVYKTRGRI